MLYISVQLCTSPYIFVRLENPREPAHAPLRRVNVVGMSHGIRARIRLEPIYKTVALEGGQAIFLAPIRIDVVKQLARHSLAFIEPDSLAEKLDNVAVFRNRLG